MTQIQNFSAKADNISTSIDNFHSPKINLTIHSVEESKYDGEPLI